MIRISKMADYAVVILESLHKHGEKLLSASVLSEKTKLPEPTVSKILKILAKNEIISSVRGIRGGYKLEKDPQDVSLENLIRVMDGPVLITTCAEGAENTDCHISESCSLRRRWGGVNQALKDVLARTSLADMFAYKS